jgi:mono/diheme cytochrome c family protein
VERLYVDLCASCHGLDGRGAWRARLFMIRPGNLVDGDPLSTYPDQYLFDIIKHGGSPIGRPGMPGFAFHLSDEDVTALVRYLRDMSKGGATAPSRGG